MSWFRSERRRPHPTMARWWNAPAGAVVTLLPMARHIAVRVVRFSVQRAAPAGYAAAAV